MAGLLMRADGPHGGSAAAVASCDRIAWFHPAHPWDG
jgi:hypothetical protein